MLTFQLSSHLLRLVYAFTCTLQKLTFAVYNFPGPVHDIMTLVTSLQLLRTIFGLLKLSQRDRTATVTSRRIISFFLFASSSVSRTCLYFRQSSASIHPNTETVIFLHLQFLRNFAGMCVYTTACTRFCCTHMSLRHQSRRRDVMNGTFA